MSMDRDGEKLGTALSKWREEHFAGFAVINGDSYILRIFNHGEGNLMLLMEDPRDLDILDKDRYHAVLLNTEKTSELKKWIVNNVL